MKGKGSLFAHGRLLLGPKGELKECVNIFRRVWVNYGPQHYVGAFVDHTHKISYCTPVCVCLCVMPPV